MGDQNTTWGQNLECCFLSCWGWGSYRELSVVLKTASLFQLAELPPQVPISGMS